LPALGDCIEMGPFNRRIDIRSKTFDNFFNQTRTFCRREL
jgi:hypothetical protein